MCGLVGAAGFIGGKTETAFKELLIVDTIRGPHSTGIAGVSGSNGIQVVKKALLPNDLLALKTTEELFSKWNSVLIGHNRWATQGAINAINAHPFEFDGLVGAHNGTLFNQDLLPDSEDFEVDSENIFHSIAKIGVAETWKRIHGAASLVWYDDTDKTINFLRNKERPMHIAFAEGSYTMFWASEPWMLEGILGKNEIKHDGIFETRENVHYSLPIPEFTVKGTKWYGSPFGHFDQKILDPYIPVKKPVGFVPRQTQTSTTQTNTGAGGSKTDGNSGRRLPIHKHGDPVTFYLDLDSKITDKHILCDDADYKGEKVMVFVPQGHWIRSVAAHMQEDEIILLQGAANGTVFTDEYRAAVVQANSVEEIVDSPDDGDDDDIPFDAAANEDLAEEVFNTQLALFHKHDKDLFDLQTQLRIIGTNPECGICNFKMKPHPDNVLINNHQMICDECASTEFAQQLIAFT